MNNSHKRWVQGRFIDNPHYKKWTPQQKQDADNDERLRVRPGPTDNAIAVCNNPDQAKWIASRLNLAAELEEWLELTDEGLHLRCGELTPDEVRLVRSVLNSIKGE